MDNEDEELEVVPHESIRNIHNISVDVGHNGFSSSRTFHTPRLDSSNGCDVRDSASATSTQVNVDTTNHFLLSSSHLSKPAISMQRLREIREERLATLNRLGIAVPSRETNPELTHHLPPIGRHKSYVGRFNSNPSTPHGAMCAPNQTNASCLVVPEAKTDSQATASPRSQDIHADTGVSPRDNRPLDLLDVRSPSGATPSSSTSASFSSSASSTSSAFTASVAASAFHTALVFSPIASASQAASAAYTHTPNTTASTGCTTSVIGAPSTSTAVSVGSAAATGSPTSATGSRTSASGSPSSASAFPLTESGELGSGTVVGVRWNHLHDARRYTPQWPTSTSHTTSTYTTTSSSLPSTSTAASTFTTTSPRARPPSQRVRGDAPRSDDLAGAHSTAGPAASVGVMPHWGRSETLAHIPLTHTQPQPYIYTHTTHLHTHTHTRPQHPPLSRTFSSRSSHTPIRTTAHARPSPAPTPSTVTSATYTTATTITRTSSLPATTSSLPATVSSLYPASPPALASETTTHAHTLLPANTTVDPPATAALPASAAARTPSSAASAASAATPVAPVAGWSAVPRTPPLRPPTATSASAQYAAGTPYMPGAVSARAGGASAHGMRIDGGGFSQARTPAALVLADAVGGVAVRSGATIGGIGVRTGKQIEGGGSVEQEMSTDAQKEIKRGAAVEMDVERLRARGSMANTKSVSRCPSTAIYTSTSSSSHPSSATGSAAGAAVAVSRKPSTSLLSRSRPLSAAMRTAGHRPVEASHEGSCGVEAHPRSLGKDYAQPCHDYHVAIGTRAYSASARGLSAGTCPSPGSARAVPATAAVDIYPATHTLTPLQSEVLQSLRKACGSHLLHPCPVPQTSAAAGEPYDTTRVRGGAPRTAPSGKRDSLSFSRAAAILAAPRAADSQAGARSRPPSATAAAASPRTVLVELERRLATARALLKETSSGFHE